MPAEARSEGTTSSDPYARVARFYDRLIEPMQAGVRRVALDVLPPRTGWSVLDVGCGTGTGLVPYLTAGCDVYGVDMSQAMLAKAHDLLGEQADLHLTDGKSLPFEDGSFDLVLTSMVLHEVAEESRLGFLAEMSRVTKPSGRMMFIDFYFGSPRGWRGPVFRGVSTIIERFSGHYSGFKSFKEGVGVPGVVSRAGLAIDEEKVVAGGNVAIYVVVRSDAPTTGSSAPTQP